VAKKVLPTIWRSPLPLHVKFESTVHLTANVGYFLVLVLSVLLLPSLLIRNRFAWPAAVNVLEFAAFFLTTVSLGLFYWVVQRENHPGNRRLGLRDMPALMALGVGMCLNNSRAIWEALLDIRTDFRRTAKFNILSRGETWKEKRYRSAGRPAGWTEAFAAGYLGFTFLWGLSSSNWWCLPFVGVFLMGYLYVGFLTMAHSFQKGS
jgi:hypothetical protein